METHVWIATKRYSPFQQSEERILGLEGETLTVRGEGGTWSSSLADIELRFPRSMLGAGFELIRLVASRVREAVADRAFPVLLSGSCFAGLGVEDRHRVCPLLEAEEVQEHRGPRVGGHLHFLERAADLSRDLLRAVGIRDTTVVPEEIQHR